MSSQAVRAEVLRLDAELENIVPVCPDKIDNDCGLLASSKLFRLDYDKLLSELRQGSRTTTFDGI